MVFTVLVVVPLALLGFAFAFKERYLAWASAMFWFIFAGYCYIESTIPWGDIYYFLFFAGGGMTIICIMASFALRERHDSLADAGDEPPDKPYKTQRYADEREPATRPRNDGMTKRTRELRQRARDRRSS